MKKRTMVFGVLAAVLLAAGTAFLIFRDPSHLTGSVTKEPDAYRLDAQYMNGIDAHTMALNAGDVLAVHIKTENGTLHLEIQAPDGNVLYSGNGQSATDFTVNIAESGSYAVTVKARSATGSIRIQAKSR